MQRHKEKRRYSAAALTAFGENGSRHTFFTDKPQTDGLRHIFLFRNYRPSLAKWQTADPLGYPDGWDTLWGRSPTILPFHRPSKHPYPGFLTEGDKAGL